MDFDECYQPIDEKIWQGRVDDTGDFTAFRWHQWIDSIDLTNKVLDPINNQERGFCFLGFCGDQGVNRNGGRVGAAKGPASIRKELANLPVRFGRETKLFDAGNIKCLDSAMERQQKSLELAVEKILDLNLFPLVLGGGHEIALGHYNGLLNSKLEEDRNPQIGIINFDAHFDLRPYPNGGNSGTMFRQIADQCQADEIDYSYLCVGIQKCGNTVNLFQTADELGVEYILAEDITDFNTLDILNTLDDYIRQNDYIYLTICSDVFSSAFAPGVSSIQPLGIEPELALNLIKYIMKSKKVISCDIAEVSPRFDQDSSTAKLAAIILFAIVNTLVGEE
ncbi:formimidoylglutamase [Sporohalobacter salinus]|uniref:formimidoylglutamase n=1 Tax=Sporohalobacter salinus TaxID=1494606 RepID=UPI0019606878|nr:formimidoylglutamase [Sporohalobacter salinus]MBM7625004.1 formiminoglutamase [Sporohalobacter salinus]